MNDFGTLRTSLNTSNNTLRGEGSFGSIFSPPPANDGYIPTKNDVVKIFNSKKDYNKTISNSNMLKNKIPSLFIKTNTYSKPYKFKNLPLDIQTKLKKRKENFIKKNTPTQLGVTNNSNIYMVRTPNLGYSCYHIFNNHIELKDTLKIVDSHKLLSEIIKCLHTIDDIINAEYIHADIKAQNVMYDFNNNTLRIIDFDILLPKMDYLKKYILPMFNDSTYKYLLFPIDSAFLFETYDRYKTPKDNIQIITTGACNYLKNEQYNTIKNIYSSSDIYNYDDQSISQAVDKITGYIKGDINTIIKSMTVFQNIKTDIFNSVYPYMDLWGFGHSILSLCVVIYIYKKDDIIEFILKTLIPGILTPHINNRLDIKGAIKICEDYMNSNQSQSSLRTPTGGKRRKCTRKRRKRRKRTRKSRR
jgi:serine/threonine protein kinase